MNTSSFEQLSEYNSIYSQTDALYGKFAALSGLSDSAFMVLYIIREIGQPCTQKTICEQWSFSKQTINSALKTLLKHELIQLQQSDTDKRIKKIVLTQKGQLFSRKYVDPVVNIERTIFIKMSEKERTALINSSRRYLEIFTQEAKEVLSNIINEKRNLAYED